MSVYYKFLNAGGRSTHQSYRWHLPANGKPGKWMPYLKGELIECKWGYHGIDRSSPLAWFGETMWTMETKGKVLTGTDGKIVTRQARLLEQVENWNPQRQRLFAADCTAAALHYVDNPDEHSVNAIEVARRLAHGKASKQELAAARDAVRATVWDATWDAARTAARAATWVTAWDAASDAVWAAARNAERAKAAFTARFWQYIDSPTIPEPWPIGFDAIAWHKEQS